MDAMYQVEQKQDKGHDQEHISGDIGNLIGSKYLE